MDRLFRWKSHKGDVSSTQGNDAERERERERAMHSAESTFDYSALLSFRIAAPRFRDRLLEIERLRITESRERVSEIPGPSLPPVDSRIRPRECKHFAPWNPMTGIRSKVLICTPNKSLAGGFTSLRLFRRLPRSPRNDLISSKSSRGMRRSLSWERGEEDAG